MGRINTGTGDDGTTGRVGGARVAKASPQMAATGAVDEANDALGLARAFAQDAGTTDSLRAIQADLFVVGADLSAPADAKDAMRIDEGHVARLDAAIDRLERALPPLTRFILPGGTHTSAHLQMARSLVRRAERAAWRLHETTPVNHQLLVYLNRLSDLLFLMARADNVRAGVEDEQWAGRD